MTVLNPDKLEPPALRASRLQIERAAVDETWCDYMTRAEPYGASEREIEHSKAISLKRIADALWGTEGTSGLLQLLNPLDIRNSY